MGALSLYAAGAGARVVAVEADPVALDQLRRNLAANPGLAGRVTVVPKAVAARAGAVRLGARRKPGDSMSSALLADAPSSWLAEATTPADLALLVGGAGRLLIKLDIEGGEYDVLPAISPLLRPRSRLLVSFHPAILRGTGEPDVAARTRAAVEPLSGWRAAPVGPTGAADLGWLPEATVDIQVSDTWLFSAPDAD